MDCEHLRYEHDGHVVTLTYDRPEQHNSRAAAPRRCDGRAGGRSSQT